MLLSHSAKTGCVVVDDDGKVGGKMILGLREAVVALGERVGSLERRMDRLEGRIEQRFDIQDARMSRQFHWLVGILLSGMIAMVGVLGGIVAAVLNK